jgi:hypothetical protein
MKLHIISIEPPNAFKLFFVHKVAPNRFQLEFNIDVDAKVSAKLFKFDNIWSKVDFVPVSSKTAKETLRSAIEHLNQCSTS